MLFCLVSVAVDNGEQDEDGGRAAVHGLGRDDRREVGAQGGLRARRHQHEHPRGLARHLDQLHERHPLRRAHLLLEDVTRGLTRPNPIRPHDCVRSRALTRMIFVNLCRISAISLEI